MLYPTIKQYIVALRLAEENFDQLTAFRLVANADGQPVMSSGNFAVVFKMQDTRDGSFHALKCFLKDQPGRAEAYRAIADELEQVTSSYLAHIRFLERELFVDTGNGGAEYPVLVMDWVEGITLDNYLRAHLSDPYALHLLAYQFGRLAAWILTQPFAHGDLKPDNILVHPDGTLVLVDYDGMFVPAMQGQLAPEMGSPDFRHPDRTDADFSEHIDDFALASILLSLRAVAHCPDYLGRYGAADRLLLSEADYRSPEQSPFLRDEFPSPDAELNRIYALFLLALSEYTLSQVSFRLFNLAKPTAPIPPLSVEVNTSEATLNEIANGNEDEYGVVYSPDDTQLLKCNNINLNSYHVKEGCKVIRSSAFYSNKFPYNRLTAITLPDGLTHIGDRAFGGCDNLTAITLPTSLTYIGDSAFEYCWKLTAITLPASLTHIGGSAFAYSGIRSVLTLYSHFSFQDGCVMDGQGKRLIAFLSDEKEVTLPASLTHIGNWAFRGCRNLTRITLPANLTHIGEGAFYECYELNAITMPASLTHIGDKAFKGCWQLNVITLPASLTHIGDFAFNGCSNLNSITLPDSLTHIGNGVFEDCKYLTTITLPDALTHIGDFAFHGCGNLTAITLPDILTHIGDNAFEGCWKLTAITLPSSLTHIGDFAFHGCGNLTAITLPDILTHIGDEAFRGCWKLTAITLPASLTHIGYGAFTSSGIRSIVNHSPHFLFQDGCLMDAQGKRLFAFLSDMLWITLPASLTNIEDEAFMGCENLTCITLPDSLKHIGDNAFCGCRNLTAITLPATLTHIGDYAFSRCKNLTAIHIPQGMTEHFKALLPSDLHSKLKELEALPKSLEYPLSKLNLQDLENFLNASVKPKLFEPVNALPGQFTINANGTKVRFSMGNLQYQAATRTWHFAEHQWEWVGDANSFTNNGRIDLFEFGSGYNPMSASYYYFHNRNFCDWGENAISNGGNTPNIWRTLTADEWKYLLKTRAGASAKMATGNIDGVHGLILLPDSWTQPSGCSFNAGFADEENDWTHNTYTLAQWTMMENAGAVFLPAAGKLLSGSVFHVGEFGSYWSSTPHHDYEASSVKFWGDSALVMSSDSYDDGLSVRVVIEVSKL